MASLTTPLPKRVNGVDKSASLSERFTIYVILRRRCQMNTLPIRHTGFATASNGPPHNMVFKQSRGFVFGTSFGLQICSLRCRVLVCHAAGTASLAT